MFQDIPDQDKDPDKKADVRTPKDPGDKFGFARQPETDLPITYRENGRNRDRADPPEVSYNDQHRGQSADGSEGIRENPNRSDGYERFEGSSTPFPPGSPDVEKHGQDSRLRAPGEEEGYAVDRQPERSSRQKPD